MGTLKAAKKRGIITFEGQLLLKGSHDKVAAPCHRGALLIICCVLMLCCCRQVPISVLKEDWAPGQ